MINFKKAYSFKIVTIAVWITFLLTASLYPSTLSGKNILRVPSSFQNLEYEKRVIGSIKVKEYIDILATPYWSISTENAVKAVGKLGLEAKDAVPYLVKLLRTLKETRRYNFKEGGGVLIMESIGNIGYVIPEATSILIEISEDYEYSDVTMTAIKTLKRLNLLSKELEEKEKILSIPELDKVCQINITFPYSMGNDQGPNTAFEWNKDYRMKFGEIKKSIVSAVLNLSTAVHAKRVEAIEFVGKVRSDIVAASCLDNVLIQELPIIAMALPDIDIFIGALFIEKVFFKNFLRKSVIGEYEWYCRDFGRWLDGGYLEGHLISKTAFSIYNELFTDQNALASFVRSFAKSLRENPSLADDLNSEAKLYAYLSKIAKSSFSLKKCIVLDADGVLWKGVIGEDGIGGIDITPKHIEFQQILKSLKENGVILAINSKNNPEDVEEVFANRPDMVLKRSDFVIIKANWQDKVTNIQEIISELNIGIESLVFLDDDPHERDLVEGTYPGVLTIDPSNGPVGQIKSLRDSGLFNKGPVAEEDKIRTKLYLAQKEREESKERFLSIEDYFRSLKMEVVIREGDKNLAYILRIAQLTQRTNQFNLTTKRYAEEDIKAFLQNPDYKIYTLDLSDKFGGAGLVGLMILNRREGDKWYIDTFCLSCRVVKHTIEDAFIAQVAKDLKSENVNSLLGIYRPTERNALVRDLYKNFGFTEIRSADGQTDDSESLWEIDLNENDLKIPEWIIVSKDNLVQASSHYDDINGSL